MRCPCCSQKIHKSAEACPHCGGDLLRLNRVYRNFDKRVRRPHDVAGVLRVQQRRKMEAWIRSLEKAFPDLFISVALVALNDGQDVRSYGFWLLNTGEFDDVPSTAYEEGGVMLVLDVHKKQMCLHFGYLLDDLVDEVEAFEVVSKAHPYLLEADYMNAVELVLKKLKAFLVKKARESRRLSRKLAKGGKV
ncbi:hypothetical protein SAMN02745181_3649 [Rubritalea squalenifaciens DSM 18772]|uniref:TPM domain-containing protein n=2 Tax=Rubritalea TaxID=361050 RepID=A0A1M6RNV3_9BACT|nr:hypothetical protein [Rubritalea squalenifaciens]SHK34146.1 hypothetical protein SAMN02745181_3649 [Rubritalea squalenifaciens DSM 18772]